MHIAHVVFACDFRTKYSSGIFLFISFFYKYILLAPRASSLRLSFGFTIFEQKIHILACYDATALSAMSVLHCICLVRRYDWSGGMKNNMKPLNAIITPANKKPGAYDCDTSKRKPTIGGPNEEEITRKLTIYATYAIYIRGDKPRTHRERLQCLETAAINRMHSWAYRVPTDQLEWQKSNPHKRRP